MNILKFFNLKKKRFLFFCVGMLFSFLTILNSFVIVEAAENFKSYENLYGDYLFSNINSDRAFVMLQQDGSFNNNINAFINNYFSSNAPGKNCIVENASYNVSCVQNDRIIFYDVVQNNSDLNNICCVTWLENDKQGYAFVSKNSFLVWIHSGNINGSLDPNDIGSVNASYDSSNNLYYYTWYIYSVTDAGISNCYFIEKQPGEDYIDSAANYLNLNNGTYILNSLFVNKINGISSDPYYDESNYYNGYLKDFSCSWNPIIPEVTSFSEINEIVDQDQFLHLTYTPQQVQINKINEYSINAKYTYNLKLKFYVN